MPKVSVLGCGTMGIKIAGDFALHGHHVRLYDSDPTALDSASRRLHDDKLQLLNEGLCDQLNFSGSVFYLSRLEDAVRNTDYIFEAIVDNLAEKQTLLQKVSQLCVNSPIIATNTINLDVTSVFEFVTDNYRTLGLRFLYPVYGIEDVEITPGKHTSGETIQKVKELMETMHKKLFFRSENGPLVLTTQQQFQRQNEYKQRRSLGSTNSASFHHGHPSATNNPSALLSPRLPTTPTEGSTVSEFATDCVVCMDRVCDTVVRPCNHLALCLQCAKSLENNCDSCPICRGKITELIRIYRA